MYMRYFFLRYNTYTGKGGIIHAYKQQAQTRTRLPSYARDTIVAYFVSSINNLILLMSSFFYRTLSSDLTFFHFLFLLYNLQTFLTAWHDTQDTLYRVPLTCIAKLACLCFVSHYRLQYIFYCIECSKTQSN